jgi:multidrug efflux pump subunit AcrA (membrane-fusion protein)
MFQIRTRFAGEIAQLKLEKTGDGFVPRYETDSISPRTRPIRVGDKVKQNELLAVIWSVPIGQAKSALMDAICSLALSNQQWKLKEEAYAKGAMSTAAMLIADRTTQADTLTRLSAERSLWTWKLTKEDIKEIENEAEELRKLIIANKLPDPNKEDKKWAEVAKALAVKWSRVEVRAPIYKTIKDIDGKDIPDPNVLLTVVEKNTNLNDYVDPIATPYPLYKLADLSRLQVMVQPHEEYYPILRSQLEARKLNWKIEVDSLPNDKPLSPPIIQVLQSLDPGLRTCIVTGYLQSDDLPVPKGQAEGFQEGWFGKYLVGQFVRATIFVDPEKDTVEIPTDALYEAEGESLVFVQDAKEKEKFYVKRVSVVQRFKEFTYVRSVLSQRDRDINPAEAEKGKRRIEALLPGELVVTHGVVELNRAFDNLASRDRIERLQNQAK